MLLLRLRQVDGLLCLKDMACRIRHRLQDIQVIPSSSHMSRIPLLLVPEYPLFLPQQTLRGLPHLNFHRLFEET
jgi:hypothetical protein